MADSRERKRVVVAGVLWNVFRKSPRSKAPWSSDSTASSFDSGDRAAIVTDATGCLTNIIYDTSPWPDQPSFSRRATACRGPSRGSGGLLHTLQNRGSALSVGDSA